jgi:hypothetical protein
MKTANRITYGNVSKQHHFNVLVCIGLLFIMSTVFSVPHSVHAQELEEDLNDPLVLEDKQDIPRKDDGPEGLEATGTDPESRGALCRFRMEGDYVHISIGDASGHGWWVNIDCDATQAIVTIQLQQYINGSWEDAGSPGQKTVYSGGGSANRAVARAFCNNSAATQWRSEIDVDVIGILDTPGKYYTPTRSLYCRH